MESWTRLGRFWRDRTRGEAGARAPIPCGASEARMRRSADARGKYKYVKARPEFSYSQCPLPYSVPLPSRSRAATVAPRLLDACLLPPLRHSPRSATIRCARCIYLRARESRWPPHARACPETAKRPTFLCTRDGTWLFIDASGPSSFFLHSPPPSPSLEQTCCGSTRSACASFSGRIAIPWSSTIFHFFRRSSFSPLEWTFFNSEVIVWRDIYIYKGYRENGKQVLADADRGIFGFNRETFSSWFWD